MPIHSNLIIFYLNTEVERKWKFWSLSCGWLCSTMECSSPSSSIHGILQARILEWLPFSSPGYLPNLGIGPPSLCSITQSCLTLCDPLDCSMPGLPVHHQLPGFTQTHVHWGSDAIQLTHPLSSPFPLAFSLSQQQRLSLWVIYSHQVPKYWSFSFSISPSNEHSGLISFRIGWMDLPTVQGTLKSLLQNHSSKTSILQCSAFFIVQLSHLYMTSGKIISLTRRTLLAK